MRTTFSPALRSMLIFSTELVFGPIGQLSAELAESFREMPQPCGHLTDKLTNCANDRGAAIIRLWLELGVQAGKPFDLGASTGQVIQGVGHFRWW